MSIWFWAQFPNRMHDQSIALARHVRGVVQIDLLEPSQVFVEILGRGPAAAPQKAFQLAMSAVGRMDVCGVPHLLASNCAFKQNAVARLQCGQMFRSHGAEHSRLRSRPAR